MLRLAIFGEDENFLFRPTLTLGFNLVDQLQEFAKLLVFLHWQIEQALEDLNLIFHYLPVVQKNVLLFLFAFKTFVKEQIFIWVALGQISKFSAQTREPLGKR